MQGRTTEIILRDPVQLQYVADASEAASILPGADLEQLEQLRKIIDKKKSTIGTKVQLKPSFTDDVCDVLAIVVKWGGEVRGRAVLRSRCARADLEIGPDRQFTHAARYQARDIAENMRKGAYVLSAVK